MAPAANKTYEVSLLLLDLVGFTSLSVDVGPSRIVELLDDMYASFDRIVTNRGARKIETIGDAFLVACGAPDVVDPITSAATVAKCALDMLGAVQHFDKHFGARLKGHKLQARIGIHYGRVLAGVIGTQMPRFQLFGVAVDDVQAMESSSEPGRVHASPQILRHLTATRASAPAAGDLRVHSWRGSGGAGWLQRSASASLLQASASASATSAAAAASGSALGSPVRVAPHPAKTLPASANVAGAGASAGAGAGGSAGTAAPVERCVPDIKVVRLQPDGSGFIERDRAGGIQRGVGW